MLSYLRISQTHCTTKKCLCNIPTDILHYNILQVIILRNPSSLFCSLKQCQPTILPAKLPEVSNSVLYRHFSKTIKFQFEPSFNLLTNIFPTLHKKQYILDSDIWPQNKLFSLTSSRYFQKS